VRDVVATVREVPGVAGFAVEGGSFESTHNHSAYARIGS
jgi:GTP cyclohydrolase FolE2